MMSYRITITGKESYILIELFGEVTLEKLFAVNSFLYQDPEFICHPYAVWDVTECTIDTEISKVIAFARKIVSERHFQTPGKTAFVTSDHTIGELAIPFIELVDKLPFQIEGFDNRVAAVQWVRNRH